MSGAPERGRFPDGRRLPYAGFGCSSIFARADFDAESASRLLDTGHAHGLRMVDTGPSYGRGVGESRLGAWLQRHAGHDMVVSTKVGTNLDSHLRTFRSFRPADMERSLTASLERLGRTSVDILYLHGPALADLTDETMRFLEREKLRGRIVWSGLNSFHNAVLEHSASLPFDVVMLQYNTVDRSAQDLVPRLSRSGKLVLAGTALAQATYNFATFLPVDRHRLWYLLRALKNDRFFFLRRRRAVAPDGSGDRSGIESALRFVVQNRGIDGLFFGTSRAPHMQANLQMVDRLLAERAGEAAAASSRAGSAVPAPSIT